MPSQDQNTALIAQLQNTNKEYQAEIGEKTFLCQTFEGGPGYIHQGNLFKHRRENKLDFDRRLARAYFQNFCAPIIGIYAGFLISQTINRIHGFRSKENFETFLRNTNGEGEGVSIFMANLIQWTAAQGEAYVIVDRPLGMASTKAEERQEGIFTTAKRLDWCDVLDWEEGENEEFNWIKIRDKEFSPRGPLDKQKQVTKYKIITRVDWRIYEVSEDGNAVMASEGVNKLGKVPVFCLEWPGGSIIKDAARLNRSVFNWCSLLDENLYQQTFAQLCLAGDNIDEVKLGTATALTYPEGSPAPSFICPPSTPCDVLQGNISAGKNAIKEMLLFQSEKGAGVESADAKGYDFAQLNNVLMQASKVFENAEMKIMNFYAAWEGENTEKISVQYPSSFDLRDIEKLVDDAIKTDVVGMGKQFSRYLKKKLSRGFVDSRDSEAQKAIDTEIDAGETETGPLPEVDYAPSKPSIPGMVKK